MKSSRLCNEANYSNNIAISGLCEDRQEVNNIINKYPYWKEIRLPVMVSIPDTSPNLAYVNSVKVAVNILNSRVIKTPRTSELLVNGRVTLTENLAGEIVTGRKIIIEGKLCQSIEYVTGDPYDNLRIMTVYNPFSAYIVIPRELEVSGQILDALILNFNVNECIEDLKVTVLDCKRMLNNIQILFYAIPTV